MEEKEKKQEEQPSVKGRQAYMDYMKGMDSSYNPEDDDAVYEEMLSYRKGNEDSKERFAAAMSEDPRFAQVLSDVMNKRRGAGAALARYYGKDFLSAEEGTPEWDELQAAEKERQDEVLQAAQRSDEYNMNIEKSQPVLEEFGKKNGIDVDDFLDEAYDKIIAPIFRGEYSEGVLSMLHKALSYDSDVEQSFDAGKVAGRNEKIQSMRREKAGDGMPRMGAGAGQKEKPKAARRTLGRASVWD